MIAPDFHALHDVSIALQPSLLTQSPMKPPITDPHLQFGVVAEERHLDR
jgi:hypothetical protein